MDTRSARAELEGQLVNHVVSTELALLVGAKVRPERRAESWCVDGSGRKITYRDGSPIDGSRIEDIVDRSGLQLTNAQAGEIIRRADMFVGAVWSCLVELRESRVTEGV